MIAVENARKIFNGDVDKVLDAINSYLDELPVAEFAKEQSLEIFRQDEVIFLKNDGRSYRSIFEFEKNICEAARISYTKMIINGVMDKLKEDTDVKVTEFGKFVVRAI